MPGDAEARARAVLAEMLMRISQGPYAALSIHEAATPEDVRASFLDLTKQFHPARYGRMSTDLQKMATEVFLGIKGAHDQLTKALGSTGRRRTLSGQPPTTATSGTERGVGVPSRPGTPAGAGTAAGTPRPGTAPTRPSTPMMTPSSGTQRPATPVQPAGRAPTPPGTQPRMGTPPPRGQTPAVGVPTQRPSQPLLTPHEPRQTPPQGLPTQRPASPAQARPSTPQRTPAPEINPPTIRYSGVQPAQSPTKAGATDEDGMLEQAMNHLSTKDWAAARLAFHALAAKVPQSRRYRALLCYARGRETQATGRADDAAMEFQRALQLDPDLEIAKEALRDVGRKSRW